MATQLSIFFRRNGVQCLTQILKKSERLHFNFAFSSDWDIFEVLCMTGRFEKSMPASDILIFKEYTTFYNFEMSVISIVVS